MDGHPTKVSTSAPGPVLVFKPGLLKATECKVVSQGEYVAFRFGNSEPMVMHYEEALRFTQFVRVLAKQAKARAGDTSRNWSAVGIVTDAKDLKR